MDFMKQSLFLCGLPEEMVGKVTETKATTLKEISEAAKCVERGFQAKQTVKAQRIAALGGGDTRTAREQGEGKSQEQEGWKQVLAFLEKKEGGASGSSDKKKDEKDEKKKKKRKERDTSKMGCYYCLEYAEHLAPDCDKRKEDREKGIYRPCIKDQPMKRDDFCRLSNEEKNRGKNFLEKPKVAGIGSTVQPDGARGQVSQNYPEEWTESAWTRYYQGNEA